MLQKEFNWVVLSEPFPNFLATEHPVIPRQNRQPYQISALHLVLGMLCIANVHRVIRE